MEQNVDKTLSDKDKEVINRFNSAENELKGIIEARAKQADVKIENLGTTLTKAIAEKQELFNQASLKAKQELEKAIKEGSDANIKKAQDAIDLITKTENEVKNAGQNYEERINQLLALETRLAKMRTQIEKKEAEKVRILKQAQDFENEMKDVIQQKIQNFRSSDLAKIKQLLTKYNAQLSAYIDLDDYNGQLENLSSDVKNLALNVEDAIETANDLVNKMDDAESALEDFNTLYEDMENLYQEAENAHSEAMDKANTNLSNIESDLSEIEERRNTVESLASDLENLSSDIMNFLSEAEEKVSEADV